MLQRQEWTSHKFNLGIDSGWTQNVLSRIKDTEIRIKHHCNNLSDKELSFKKNNQWSIKEHIGHLIDLEELHYNRLLEFKALKNQLTAADMSNLKTREANHNAKTLGGLLNEFNQVRTQFINEVEGLENTIHNHVAIHPRLNEKMKVVDMLFFVGEHDDHHLTSILEVKKLVQ